MKTLFAGQMKRYNEKFGIKFIGWYNVAYGWDFDIRTFRAVFGETPHRYLQRRRVERSMFLLRETDRSVTDICLDVGFNSLGTFSRTFREIVGEAPSEHRLRNGPMLAPNCYQMAAARPSVAATRPLVAEAAPATKSSSFGEATAAAAP